MTFRIKRVYDPASTADGTRVLVDRLWPRGIRKADARWEYWLKDVAPSPDLRRWFNHDPERFAEFGRRYAQELRGGAALEPLRKLGQKKVVTLLYGAHDPQINHAAVLLSVLRGRKPP
jgi:uncharacterized protein YeaO (DUF488 family)